jgi:hypothetical protein
MRSIIFYRTLSGKCPVEKHFDTLTDTQLTKITWVLKLIREAEHVSTKYFKKLVNTDDIWEVRVGVGSNIFRLLGRLLRNENFFKFKAKNKFDRRHTCGIPRIKFTFPT